MLTIGTVNTYFETPLIPEDDLPWFLGIRIPLLLLTIPLAILLRIKPYSSVGHFLFGVLLVIYTSHGQWFRPFYEYSLFQILIFYTLLFYPSRKIFLSILGVGTLIFIPIYAYRFEEVVLRNETTLEENYLSLLAFGLTLFGIFKLFSEERAFKEQALARFGYLGKHSAAILHDLKTTVAIPRIYTELAEEELKKGDIASAQHRLKETLASLESMQTIISKLNQMTQMTHFQVEEVNLRDVVEDVRGVLRMKLAAVELHVVGDAQVEASRSFTFSFILNLVMNSIEVFQARQVQEAKISVTLSGKKMVFQDNGGGFTSDVLEKIGGGVAASTKAEASGLGLYLLVDGVRNMGGKVLCSNFGEGARIEVQFRS